MSRVRASCRSTRGGSTASIGLRARSPQRTACASASCSTRWWCRTVRALSGVPRCEAGRSRPAVSQWRCAATMCEAQVRKRNLPELWDDVPTHDLRVSLARAGGHVRSDVVAQPAFEKGPQGFFGGLDVLPGYELV